MNTNIITTFVNRLAKIGISIELVGNIPWIYLKKVNGNPVLEKYEGEHGFTAFWYPVKVGGNIRPTSIKEIFKIIRKYK